MRRLVLAAALLGAAAATGCETMQSFGGGAASQYLALVPDAVKQSVSGYLGGLGEINSVLAGIRDTSTALAKVPLLDEQVGKLAGFKAALDALPQETRDNTLKAYADDLKKVNGAFEKQASRIRGDSALSALTPLLDRVTLFG